uniref:Uncharacterized protein n=1 Tax=Glossina pallidipes TaxID=7398 RepID=A0A1A9ZLF9_GLOPL
MHVRINCTGLKTFYAFEKYNIKIVIPHPFVFSYQSSAAYFPILPMLEMGFDFQEEISESDQFTTN